MLVFWPVAQSAKGKVGPPMHVAALVAVNKQHHHYLHPDFHATSDAPCPWMGRMGKGCLEPEAHVRLSLYSQSIHCGTLNNAVIM